MELVVPGHLLDQLAAAVVVEDDEVPDQGQEAVRLADTLQHDLQLGHAGVGQGFAGDGAPGLEPLSARAQSADAGIQAVGDHQNPVHGEQGRQFGLVGLELLPGGPDRDVLVGGVLQLDDAQGQAVEEQDDVGAAGVPVLGDGELVDRQPVVVVRFVEVDDLGLVPPDGAVAGPVLHVDAVDQHPVEGPVPGLQGHAFRVGQLAEDVFQRCGGQGHVQPGQCVPQVSLQDHLAVVAALRTRCVRGDVRPVRCLPAEGSKPVKGGGFDGGFIK